MQKSDSDGAAAPSAPDPRPQAIREGSSYFVRGMGCRACGYASAVAIPWCPRCRSEVSETLYGPEGTVWSSTVVRIPLPNREPPYALAYVDLKDGPRVLAHIPEPVERLAIGQTVHLTEPTADGDLQVVP